MTDFDVDPEEILAFHVDDEYLFSHYFERQDVFEDLQEYYNREAYRFEVSKEEFEDVQHCLQEAYYDPTVVEDLEPYRVIKEKYTEHAEILQHSVLHWERGDYNFFLMKDDLAVKDALERGAMKLAETDKVAGL